jgi:hypothetical protein
MTFAWAVVAAGAAKRQLSFDQGFAIAELPARIR